MDNADRNQEVRRSSINEAIARMKKKWDLPEDSMVITTANKILPPERIPTGLMLLDNALDGGLPRGRWNVIVGQEHSGKSSLVYRVVGNTQKMGLVPLLIDAEGRFSAEWARMQGVDTDTLEVISPDRGTTAEAILDIYRGVADAKAADLIVIDSISALSPEEEKKKSMAENTMASLAKRLSQFFRVATGANRSANICAVLVAQPRSTMSQYESKMSKLAGGQAIKSYGEYILYISRFNPNEKSNITREEGFIMSVDLIKVTGRHSAEELKYEFIFDVGIDPATDIVKYGISKGMIQYATGGVWNILHKDKEPEKGRGYANLVGRVSQDIVLQDTIRNYTA